MQSIASLSRAQQAAPIRPAQPAVEPVSNDSDSFAKNLPKLTTAKVSDLEVRATALAKKVDVVALDPQLHSQKFEDWFRQAMGPEESYTWEMNDCGEATGDPDTDRQRDMPICIEARAQSPAEMEMETSVILQVGTEQKGLFDKPVLRAIVQQEGEEYIDIKHLHDLSSQNPVD
jgi:hypothetical protein